MQKFLEKKPSAGILSEWSDQHSNRISTLVSFCVNTLIVQDIMSAHNAI